VNVGERTAASRVNKHRTAACDCSDYTVTPLTATKTKTNTCSCNLQSRTDMRFYRLQYILQYASWCHRQFKFCNTH